MVVSNNKNSRMSGRKHLLDDHRDMVDYRQIPASVAPVPASVRLPLIDSADKVLFKHHPKIN